MKHKKYIMCSGLAFADHEDMKLLHDYAIHGWVFKELKYGCIYVLYKEEPCSVIFDYDIQKVKGEDKEEYLRVFEDAGWTLIGKWNKDVRFFQATVGTQTVHSESETRSEQYRVTYYVSSAILLVGIVLLLVGIYQDITLLYTLGGACIGGGGILCIACHQRVRGKRVASNPRSYAYQVIKLVIGLLFLCFTYRYWAGMIFNYVPLAVGIWFVIGSLYSFYQIKKERKLHD